MSETERTHDGITAREFVEAEGSGDWPVVGDGATTFFRTGSLAASIRFVTAIGDLAGIEDHRPDLDIRADGVTVRLLTYEGGWYGMSRRDVGLAQAISRVAAQQGLAADPSVAQSVGPIIVGAVDIPRVMPFWQALLGYERRADSPDEDLVDPRGRGPGIWFEAIEEGPRERNRMHVTVWLPYEQAETRLAAALAAGGTVIYDEQAPAWWTMVDPEGNEADISTIKTRD